MYVCTYVCMYACTCVCVSIYAYIHICRCTYVEANKSEALLCFSGHLLAVLSGSGLRDLLGWPGALAEVQISGAPRSPKYLDYTYVLKATK